jgi:DNA-binding GntR family transcriptional regulator
MESIHHPHPPTVGTADTGLIPLTRSSFREQALREIRAGIIIGTIESGRIYSARALAADLGVSATPVREALLDLVRDGLVEAVPNRGFRVTAPSDTDLDEVFELRLLLEVPVTGLVAEQITPASVALLRTEVERGIVAADTGDLVEFLDADRSFHHGILALHGNGRLTDLIDRLRMQARLYGLPTLQRAGSLSASAREHAELLDALARGDRDAAEELMRKHLRHTRGIWAGLREAMEADSPAEETDEGEREHANE